MDIRDIWTNDLLVKDRGEQGLGWRCFLDTHENSGWLGWQPKKPEYSLQPNP